MTNNISISEDFIILRDDKEENKFNKKYYGYYILKKVELDKNEISKIVVYLKKTRTIIHELNNFLII